MSLKTKLIKAFLVLSSFDRLWWKALRSGVAASIEHLSVLKSIGANTVVDVGANRGQFALAARHVLPNAWIYSFEPIPLAAECFQTLFSGDTRTTLYRTALGSSSESKTLHVSRRDDSSSILPIGSEQEKFFPGTSESHRIEIIVGRLDEFISKNDMVAPALLKLDVQGFELSVLQGCSSLLSCFEWVYVECSFVELYDGQPLAHEVIAWLREHSFQLSGIYNSSYSRDGQAIQADFLFARMRDL